MRQHFHPLRRELAWDPLQAWDQNVFNQVAHVGLVPFQTLPNNDHLVSPVYGACCSAAMPCRASLALAAGNTGLTAGCLHVRAAWLQLVPTTVAATCAHCIATRPLRPQVLGANHSLVFGVLPIAQFASGHTFFVQRLFEFQEVKPYVVHTTFQVGRCLEQWGDAAQLSARPIASPCCCCCCRLWRCCACSCFSVGDVWRARCSRRNVHECSTAVPRASAIACVRPCCGMTHQNITQVWLGGMGGSGQEAGHCVSFPGLQHGCMGRAGSAAQGCALFFSTQPMFA